ncbi:Xylanolytic transcriptional activator xlnR, partial [Tolypocladium capitatum]
FAASANRGLSLSSFIILKDLPFPLFSFDKAATASLAGNPSKMLSNPLQRSSSYHHAAAASVFDDHMNQPQINTDAFATFGPGSSYGFLQLQRDMAMAAASPPMTSPASASRPKPNQHRPTTAGASSGTSRPIRRRISRACDQCNQLRTKCDGRQPCAHCIELSLGCEYMRQKKKRGKASRKDLAARAAAQAGGALSPNGDGGNHQAATGRADAPASLPQARGVSRRASNDELTGTPSDAEFQSRHTNASSDMSDQSHLVDDVKMDRGTMEDAQSLALNGYGRLHTGYDGQGMGGGAIMTGPTYSADQGAMPAYHPALSFGLMPQSQAGFDGPLNGYSMASGTSPGWPMPMPLPSPPGQSQTEFPHHHSYTRANLRYPVLEPLIPHIGGIMPVSLACDLIDLYFSSSSSARMHPMSPYVLGFVFRKKTFLHPTRPRKCRPALLASMLWVAAQTSDAPLLTSSPSARTGICQMLLDLTVRLLKPLIHTPMGGESYSNPNVGMGAVALGGLGVETPGSVGMDALTGDYGAFVATGHLDDVATYAHLATVVSASEYKGASLRWWNAAWSLARELKLGRELPPNEARRSYERDESERDGLDEHDACRNRPGRLVTEEEREERRRIWWLVYITDRHLALCYNRPLFLLDVECAGLLQPMDDTAWQNGVLGSCPETDPDAAALGPMTQGFVAGAQSTWVGGSRFECRGHGIFGYFLPLMTILGEIVDLHHAKNHPRFGLGFRGAHEWDDQAEEIRRHLDVYEQSLKRFEQRYLPKPTDGATGDQGRGETAEGQAAMDLSGPSTQSVYANASTHMAESEIQARIVLAYGTHIMHVLHILLAGKWDPISLLDDDLWISSQEFITSTSHAVTAAAAIDQMLEHDPGLEFMPFFFGVYLLQGSFLLLLLADKLQYEASPNVVGACETIVRAHEACIVTLGTEYQRNFSEVMRCALAVVRGRVPEDLEEQHRRRRELLGLYRWNGDGTGLAL